MKKRLFARWIRLTLVTSFLGAVIPADSAEAQEHRLLVVTVTKGFRHGSIPIAEAVLGRFGEAQPELEVVFARNDDDLADQMTPEALEAYDGVIFANSSGMLPLPDPDGLIDWIRSGNAFIGMHAAADTLKDFPPYVEMLGASFRTHREQVEVEALTADRHHPAAKPLGRSYTVFDEIYLFDNYDRSRVHLLLTLDRHPNTKQPGHYPIAWNRRHGEGRVFFTALGHRDDVWTDRHFQHHIFGGIRWALGLESGDAEPQSTRARLSGREREAGFRPLFDGVSLEGWRLRHPDGHPSWSAQNGMLVNELPEDEDAHGTDLVSEATFRDFTLRYEYMIPEGANSGLYLRGRHEIQILDDFERGEPREGGNGAIYSIKAPDYFVSRRPGAWQEVEATIEGNRMTVVQNGVKIHDNVQVDQATGGELDSDLDAPGPIMLQGDHGAIAFRRIRIKPLD